MLIARFLDGIAGSAFLSVAGKMALRSPLKTLLVADCARQVVPWVM